VLIFLDVETTGLEPKDRICAIGIIALEPTPVLCSELIRPPRKIRPEAMALHHITNEMVAEAPEWKQSGALGFLDARNEAGNILVGHNIEFDLQMLQREGFVWQGEVIDTLKCSRRLIEELPQYTLQYLRYELRLYRAEAARAAELGIEIRPHGALSDAFFVLLLHEYLAELAGDAKLVDLTASRALMNKFTFGKYKGRYIEEIALNDPGYLRWMLEEMFDMDEDLRYSVEHYLKGG